MIGIGVGFDVGQRLASHGQEVCVDLLLGLVVDVDDHGAAVVQVALDEGARRHVDESGHLDLRVEELQSGQLPKDELTRAPMSGAARVVVHRKNLDAVQQLQLT